MQPEDRARLGHMLDAANRAREFIVGRSERDLEQDIQLLWATVRAIEIIGEAGGRVGAETRGQLASIPWAQIVAMRNRLIHGYYDVNPRLVWKTVVEDLLPLIAQLQDALGHTP